MRGTRRSRQMRMVGGEERTTVVTTATILNNNKIPTSFRSVADT